MTTLKDNLEILDAIEMYEDDWNGYGAEKFDADLVEFCREIVRSLGDNQQPWVNATGRHSIQMEYETSDKIYLEFEIFSRDDIRVYREDKLPNAERIVSLVTLWLLDNEPVEG